MCVFFFSLLRMVNASSFPLGCPEEHSSPLWPKCLEGGSPPISSWVYFDRTTCFHLPLPIQACEPRAPLSRPVLLYPPNPCVNPCSPQSISPFTPRTTRLRSRTYLGGQGAAASRPRGQRQFPRRRRAGQQRWSFGQWCCDYCGQDWRVCGQTCRRSVEGAGAGAGAVVLGSEPWWCR